MRLMVLSPLLADLSVFDIRIHHLLCHVLIKTQVEQLYKTGANRMNLIRAIFAFVQRYLLQRFNKFFQRFGIAYRVGAHSGIV